MVPGFECGTCKKKIVCIKRKRMNIFPKLLVINMFVFLFDNWVPKKLDIDLHIPLHSPLDFERFRGLNG